MKNDESLLSKITRINDFTLLKHLYNLKLKAKGTLLVSATDLLKTMVSEKILVI